MERKKTCSRLKVPSKFVHIDVPMYAIPKDEFVEKETVLKASLESYGSRTFVLDSADYTLDKDKVHLAIREGGWQKSDPKFVADWFQEAITDIGEHVRRTSRFLKAWRDVQWESGGPSSICLMKCIVDTLRNNICDPHDFGDVLLDVANNLELQLNNGVRSPDPSSSSHLFPPRSEHTNEQKAIVDKAIELQVKLNQAISAPTKQIALVYLQELFGERVTNPELIKERKAIPAYSSETVVLPKREISSSMRSG
ncbi:CBASS cGAMP synthase [Vibrio splendidus]